MKYQKSFIKITILIAIIVGIVIIGGSGYFGYNWFKNYQAQQAEKKKQSQDLIENQQKIAEIEKEKQKQVEEKQNQESSEIEKLKQEIEQLKKKPQNTQSSKILDDQIISAFANVVVRIVCVNGSNGNIVSGSGVIFGLNRNILTNSHVVADADLCQIGITDDVKNSPQRWFEATVATNIPSLDIASLQLINPPYFTPIDTSLLRAGAMFIQASPPQFGTTIGSCDTADIKLGDPIIIIGYPTLGGNTITVTEGVISGFEGFRIKTSAKLEYGSSGGGAFLKKTGILCWFGIPTAVVRGELESLGSIINYSLIHEQSGQ